MKFYNHNHQCYIMGEGTFAGKQCEKYPRDKDDVIIKDGKNNYACMHDFSFCLSTKTHY